MIVSTCTLTNSPWQHISLQVKVTSTCMCNVSVVNTVLMQTVFQSYKPITTNKVHGPTSNVYTFWNLILEPITVKTCTGRNYDMVANVFPTKMNERKDLIILSDWYVHYLEKQSIFCGILRINQIRNHFGYYNYWNKHANNQAIAFIHPKTWKHDIYSLTLFNTGM